MDKIYEDFKTKILPEIHEGLIVSKDYFIDMYSRYIKYLIVTDTICLIASIVGLITGIICVFKIIKLLKTHDSDDLFVHILFTAALLITSFAATIVNTDNVLKDLFIPEIRIIELIQTQKH